jgi:hypothetical protein
VIHTATAFPPKNRGHPKNQSHPRSRGLGSLGKVLIRTGMARRGSSVPGIRMARSVTNAAPRESRRSHSPPGMSYQRRSGTGAPQVQHGGRNADGDAVAVVRILPNSPARLRPGRSRDHAPPGRPRRSRKSANPRLHHRSRQTMEQTARHRKRIVFAGCELAAINNKAAKT